MSQATYTSEFRHAVEEEENRLLRRRFLLFTGIIAFFGVCTLLLVLVMTLTASSLQGAAAVANASGAPGTVTVSGFDKNFYASVAAAGISVLIYIVSFFAAWRGRLDWLALRTLSYWLIFLDGVIHLTMKAAGLGGMGMFGIMLSHVLASLFLPWSPAQALRPIIPLLALNAFVVILFRDGGATAKSLGITFSLFIAAPGVFICWLKTSRRLEQHKLRFLAQRYSEVRRELVDAQRIHQSLFPEPIDDGPVRFRYRYEPMRQIGGDYLYRHVSDGDGVVSIVVMDVTGHGIPAALTVNRLHGELQRLFAEHPRIAPADTLRLLNRYVNLTLANHAVYVTAFCCRVDPARDTLEYASGGHPPAFLRAVDGTIEQLRDTAPQLGVFPDAEFQCDEPRTIRFARGDALIAFTDGAIEARNREGRMLGITGVESVIARPVGSEEASKSPPDWTLDVMSALERFRHGPPADDTLVIEITRSLSPRGPAPIS